MYESKKNVAKTKPKADGKTKKRDVERGRKKKLLRPEAEVPKSHRIEDAKEIYSQYLATLGSFPPPTSKKSDGRSLLRFFLRLLRGNL